MTKLSVTPYHVREALAAIRYARSLAGSPLTSLALVGERLRSEGLSDSPEAREWALATVIKTMILEHLARLRGWDAPLDGLSLAQERDLLEADFAVGHADREAWSILYYRFISEAGLPVREIADHVGIGRRTLARRIRIGVHALAHSLRDSEGEGTVVTAGPNSGPAAVPTGAGRDGGDAVRLRLANAAAPLDTFVGRDPERAGIVTALATARLVTIVGAGGCGKTRLATEVACQLVASYPGGAWFVDLEDAIGDGQVAAVIARAVDASDTRGDTAPLDAVIALLAGREALLVLDNCEHVITGAAQAAVALLCSCADLRILATSREPLRVSGEHVRPLGPLPLPAPEQTSVEAVAGAAAVALFLDRAQAAMPGFALTSANAPDVARLCAELDGLPLAIEIAAAHVRAMPVRRIRERMSRRARTLGSGDRLTSERHRTLEDVVEWSVNLLEPRSQACFYRLSVLAGEWDMEAACAVCADDGSDGSDGSAEDAPSAAAERLGDVDDVADVRLMTDEVEARVLELVDKSLVVASEDGDAIRFRLLNTLRTFARERLAASGGDADVAARHAAHYLSMVEASAGDLVGSAQATAVARLRAAYPNIRAAATWALARPAPDIALRFGVAIGRYCQIRGRPSDGLELLSAALATRAPATDPRLYMAALEQAGSLARQSCDYPRAAGFLRECFIACEAAGDRRGLANTLRIMGSLADEQGRVDEARAHYEQALVLYTEIGDRWGQAAARNNIGLLLLHDGDAAAAALLEASLADFRVEGDRWAEGVVSLNLGHAVLDQGRVRTARALYESSLGIARELNDDAGIGAAHKGLAEAAELDGDMSAARMHFARSIDPLRASGDLQAVAEWIEAVAGLDAATERPWHAVVLFAAADRLRRTIGATPSRRSLVHCHRHIENLRATMDADAFDAAWRQGEAMEWGAAVARAVEGDSGGEPRVA